MALQTRDLSKGTTVQVLSEIRIEYDFPEPRTATVRGNLRKI